MPWPDNLAMFVSTLVHGQDERGRLMRRTILRYVNLCFVLTLRMMSPRVKKRFPTMEHLVEAGFLQPSEKRIFEDLDRKTSHPKYWMPLVWAGGIITRARKEGRVKDDFSLKSLIDGLNVFRAGCGGMLNYDWISIPLVYTQVVTLAVYMYFMATLMGNQFLDTTKHYPKHEVDLVVPVFTFLQFCFYMGWLKVAESLVNPFGEDDDDFELNWLVDRNLQVSYVIVDEMHQEHPELVRDQYWDDVFPAELPYTAASKQYQTGPPTPSTENVEVSEAQAEFMPLETVLEEVLGGVDDIEDDDSGASRRETHPMRILKGKPAGSTGSINASSSSGPPPERKNSVFNMLSKLFRRVESGKDLGSNLGSTASLPGQRARCASRMSSRCQSQAQSHASMARESTYQDEMFHMSDVSLAASVLTIGSHIQMVAPRRCSVDHDVEETADTSEVAQLLPSAARTKDTPRKISFSKDTTCSTPGEVRRLDNVETDDVSDVSGSSVKTSYLQENADDVSISVSPKPKMFDSQRIAAIRTRKVADWRDPGPGLLTLEQGGDAPRIVVPFSPPVTHSFAQASTSPSVSTPGRERRRGSLPWEDAAGTRPSSSLTRSVRQQEERPGPEADPAACDPALLASTSPAVAPPADKPGAFTPSAAIPVPALSPAHEAPEGDGAAMPLGRRTIHEFRELAPISEQCEADSLYCRTPRDDSGRESTV
ncbi:uncharacterized protein LOC134538846 isoform X2 [Bacillus rossius redtenbacheri]